MTSNRVKGVLMKGIVGGLLPSKMLTFIIIKKVFRKGLINNVIIETHFF